MKKIVIIGDLVASRKLADRNFVQKNLRDVLKKINKTADSLSPYTITLGDEFQAVLQDSSTIFTDAAAIMFALHPVKVRFSFGIGTIATSINTKLAIGMDGEAFHNARKGIEEIKGTGYCFNVTGITSENSNMIRKSLFLISNLISHWNKNQLRIFFELCMDNKVKNISKLLHISEQAVYKSIKKEEMHLVREITEEISAFINKSLK